MPHRVLPHTADTGIEATAGTLPELLAELLAAMFALMADTDRLGPSRWIETAVEADTVTDLVVDTLSEALYRSEVEDLMLCAFEVEAEPGRATVRLGGVPMGEAEPTGASIKAVTYHALAVEERPDGWYGRVYFDV